MADNDAYRKRSQELLENVEYKDISLRNIFYSFLDEFEDSYEPVLAGETTKEQLAMMGIVTDVKMSDEGLATLREAAANEVDELTADLRKKEIVMDQLCSELEPGDPITLGRMLTKAFYTQEYSRLHRYEDLLASLSADDRAKLDTVFFEPRGDKGQHPGVPIDADHIYDTLAVEFPERIIERAKRECESHKRNKGKHYVKYVERYSNEPVYDDSGNVVMVMGSSGSGYKLVDK